jgi:hypothetical protein
MSPLRIESKASRLSYSDVVITSFEVRSMPVASLWAPVSTVPIFMEEVKDSIEAHGLLNPLIVVRLPREDILSYFEAVKKVQVTGKNRNANIPDSPVVNAIWGGSNRLSAVKQLGYTHVDCVLIPDFQTAMQVQVCQRATYASGESDDAIS